MSELVFDFIFSSIRLPFRSAASTQYTSLSTDVILTCTGIADLVAGAFFIYYARQFVRFSFCVEFRVRVRTHVHILRGTQLTPYDIFDHYNYLCFN